MTRQRRNIILIILVLVIIAILLAWVLIANVALGLTNINVGSGNLPDAFDGFKIAHVSDLHNQKFDKLIPMLRRANPDIIAITGDIIHAAEMDVALDFASQAVKIAPCFYVPGNHEARMDNYESLESALKKLGVQVLDNKAVDIELADGKITLLGVKDPAFEKATWAEMAAKIIDEKLKSVKPDEEIFTVLLSHRPELFDVYCANGIDLALCGHAHGGQFRLPFIGGIFAPNQGLFPKYDSGLYTAGKSNMVVSRGIGNSSFPLRFNNYPELILIELKKQGN